MKDQSNVKTASGINVLIALWLFVSPFLMGFAGTAFATNLYIVAAIIGILALIRFFATSSDTAWLSWINIILGLWLFISPFIFGFIATAITWNVILFGIAIAALASWSSASSAAHHPVAR